MAVATAMSHSHSRGMIKSRFAFYSSWFLLHLEQAEFMLRYQRLDNNICGGAARCRDAGLCFTEPRAQQGDRQVFTILISAETTHEKCESCIAMHFALVNRYMILSFGTF